MPPVDFDRRKKELEENHGIEISERDVVSHALYPKVMDDYLEFRKTYGPVDRLDTRTFLVGPDVDEEINVSFGVLDKKCKKYRYLIRIFDLLK